MWSRLLRVTLFTCLPTVVFSVVTTRTARLHADDVVNHCRSDAVAYSYYYSNGSQDAVASDLIDTYAYPDYGACLSAGQNLAINVAGRSCVGVRRGEYGIVYSHVVWDVFWNEEYQGTVDQQYDCGDVSVY